MGGSLQKIGFENDSAKTIVFSFAGQGSAGVVGYEWVNFFKDRPVKLVSVRDVQKAYYMGTLFDDENNAISNGIDSHVELFKRIISESNCENVVFTGSSLGGYASVLFGVLLNVNYVMPYSAQTFIKKHSVYGSNDRPHLRNWAYRHASKNDQDRYFDLTELNYNNFTGVIHYHWSRSWRDERYVNHISEFCKTYRENKDDGDFTKNDAIDFRVHNTIRLHSKLCQKLKQWGYLEKHFEEVIK